MKSGDERQDLQEEATLAALLRAAGPRPLPSAAATAAARAAIEAEWRTAVAAARAAPRLTQPLAQDDATVHVLAPRPVRRTAWLAAAASVAVAAIGAWLVRANFDAPPQRVAALQRIEGVLEQDDGDGRWRALAAGDPVLGGARLRTTAGGRAALALASGVELRLDSDTSLTIADAGRAELAQGAVYVDSGAEPGPAARDLVLETPAGAVRHLGTQYQVRVDSARVNVGVREGRVALEGPAGAAIGAAGEQLTVAGGRLTRAPLPRDAAEWRWIAEITPPFDLQGRTVEEFLVWAARETGRTVVYTSPEAGRVARSVTLSGTVEGLAPDAAVAAVLSTTTLRPEIGAQHIRVTAAGD